LKLIFQVRNKIVYSILETEDLSEAFDLRDSLMSPFSEAFDLRDSLIESVFGSICSSGFLYRVRFEADKSEGARIVWSLWSSS
jgi:hypothetical protein